MRRAGLLKRWFLRWLMNRLPEINTLLAIFDELLAHISRFILWKSKPRPKRPNPTFIMLINQQPRDRLRLS